MSKSKDRKRYPYSRPGNYRIRVLGSLDESWSERLGGLRITAFNPKDRKGPVTELIGKVRDQAELSGILETLYEMHFTLLSVEMLEADNGKQNGAS
jgi:hypothetical protein